MQHGIPVWQHIGQSITASSRHRRDTTSDVKSMLNPDKQIYGWRIRLKDGTQKFKHNPFSSFKKMLG